MRKILIQTDYKTQWGQSLHISGSIPELGTWDNEKTLKMECCNSSVWQIYFETPNSVTQIEFNFLVVENGKVIREEFGKPHFIILSDNQTEIKCTWQEKPKQAYFNTSIFRNSIFKHENQTMPKLSENQILLIVTCLHIEQSQELVISGNTVELGEWSGEKAIHLQSFDYGKWYVVLDKDVLSQGISYKFAIRDKISKKVIEWEDGENRYFDHKSDSASAVLELLYKKKWVNWKAAGVAIPVFSLRSEKSFGIGEFSDLELMVNWAANARLKVIQVLPINDTTATYTWLDSYPYNAISTYALHPIYLGLHEFPLKNETKNKKYKVQAKKLNDKAVIDYDKVIELKTEYIKELYEEIGKSILQTKEYKEFYKRNEAWLFPYACFSYLRDKYKTAHIAYWEENQTYDKERFELLIKKDKDISDTISQVYFTQYLLHKQLTEAKNYAYTKGVVLKGDIPIGISPNSVEAWTEPHLFNLDSQTGAPPDDFSINGQNWGFPTYNWKEMEKDGYQWWIKRFVKMADYFDAYRIDHILGFFRIWEIPNTSVYGLLGHFSPALPMSRDEIQSWGFTFENEMAVAMIHEKDLLSLFGKYSQEVKDRYLRSESQEWYSLKNECDNQKKVQKLFHEKTSTKDITIRDGLYAICNEVLFVYDKSDSNMFHPRISIQLTLMYKYLDMPSQNALDKLYENFFYHRHTQFWKDEAMNKLPALVGATNMLVCGEDLGMVPSSVPSVMRDLQILSLEIQRMPKQLGVRFENLQQLPYLSVTTTSTHDMAPIRLWWQEDKKKTQEYYVDELNGKGLAPKDCNTAISIQIIRKHLESPAMLSILPLQDWLAVSDKLRRENPEEEKINEPSNPHHNWNYRMHITLEDLIEENDFSDMLSFFNEESER